MIERETGYVRLGIGVRVLPGNELKGVNVLRSENVLPSELLARGGAYAKLYQNQFSAQVGDAPA